MKNCVSLVTCLLVISLFASSQVVKANLISNKLNRLNLTRTPSASRFDTATFATGCFWCTEAKFEQLRGVKKVISGYTGGVIVHPTYKQVSSGKTGHAEACNIVYDSGQITYDQLLEAFFRAHDPTQLNRQGADVGTQYRSAIFYRSKAQQQKATYYIQQLNVAKVYPAKIVTQVVPFHVFYLAEKYHQDFYAQNPNRRYCRLVIQPELEKFKQVFQARLKP